MTCPFCTKKILEKEAFYESKLSRGIYNLKPILPGHVLIVPKKHRERLEQLNETEIADLFQAVQDCCHLLKRVYHAKAFSILIQDGKLSGQSIPHLHVHIVPMDGSINTSRILEAAKVSALRSPISASELKKQVELLKR